MQIYTKYNIYNLSIYNSNWYKTFKLNDNNLFLNTFNFKKRSMLVRILNFLIILINMFIQYNFFACELRFLKYLYFCNFYINLILYKFFSYFLNLNF
jgi:hypothetical protein